MLAIDTNLIVRYLTGDHPIQATTARALIDSEAVFVATTVLLETEWVLRSVYGFSGTDCAAAMSRFAGLPTVTLEDPMRIAAALARVLEGLDFADALHLSAAEECAAFVTFDQRLIKAAATTRTPTVRAP
jgi:predicted nucleic-acid-binding protein